MTSVVCNAGPPIALTGIGQVGIKGRKFKMTAKFDDPALNPEIAGIFNKP